MATRSFNIRFKLITVSAALLVVVVGLFGILNNIQSRRLIDDVSRKLQEKTTEALRSAGRAQLQLLAEIARIALVQSDYSTLQTTVRNIGRQDKRVTAVAVVNTQGTVLAHSDPNRSGQPAKGVLKERVTSEEVKLFPEAMVEGQRSMAFGAAVKLKETQLCTVFLAYSLEPLRAELEAMSQVKSREAGASLRNTLIVGLLAVLLGVLMTIVQSINLTRPIQALAKQADRMANGDLEARVQIKSKDEIGFLGARFNFMAEQMMVLMRETLAKATMEKELEVASAIQSTLVPDAASANLKGLELAGFFKPATHCGGDWWTYYRLADDRTLILIGDVTGHGVGAAMITAAAQGAVTTMLEVGGGRVELRSLLRSMNAAIHAAAKGKFVMTCFASVYDPISRVLAFANAGHNFPYYYDAGKQSLTSLVIRGNRLGDIADSQYETGEMQLKGGDGMFWYTDGIVECEDIRGEEYGERRFRAEIQKNSHLPPAKALEAVIGHAMAFYGEVPQKDDITVVVGKFV